MSSFLASEAAIGARAPGTGPAPAARTVRLKGREFFLRPLRPDDAERLRRFFYSHSEETRYLRFGYAKRDMTVESAARLVGVDQTRDAGLALFETRDGEEAIAAVGRYFLDDDAKGGEAAFVTREDRRNLGMASLLLTELIALARARGLTRLWAQVLHENADMLHVFRRQGFKTVHAAGNELTVELPLTARAPRKG